MAKNCRGTQRLGHFTSICCIPMNSTQITKMTRIQQQFLAMFTALSAGPPLVPAAGVDRLTVLQRSGHPLLHPPGPRTRLSPAAQTRHKPHRARPFIWCADVLKLAGLSCLYCAVCTCPGNYLMSIFTRVKKIHIIFSQFFFNCPSIIVKAC